MIEGTFGATGETFFYSLVRELAQFLETDAVLLAICEDERHSIYRTLAYWCDNNYIMNQAISLLYLDLDQFKLINDAAGHVAGDELLKQVCSLLANQLRGSRHPGPPGRG